MDAQYRPPREPWRNQSFRDAASFQEFGGKDLVGIRAAQYGPGRGGGTETEAFPDSIQKLGAALIF